MPRLRDRRVLDEGIVDMPLIWQTDAFALATGFDESASRYIGLWTPETRAPHPRNRFPPVRSPRHRRQAARSRSYRRIRAGSVPSEREGAENFEPDPEDPSALHRNLKTRFFGVKTLNPDKIAVDFKNVADEIIANFREQAPNWS